ncbi:MAG: 2-hydroxyacid dehydrogenase, partial [Mesorhizobium sp.]
MTQTEAKSPVAVLVPGRFNDHAIGRIDQAFKRVRIERADP